MLKTSLQCLAFIRMEFDILGVSISDDSLNGDEMRSGNAQDPGKRFPVTRVVLSNIF